MMKYDPVGMFTIRLSTLVSCFATFGVVVGGGERGKRRVIYVLVRVEGLSDCVRFWVLGGKKGRNRREFRLATMERGCGRCDASQGQERVAVQGILLDRRYHHSYMMQPLSKTTIENLNSV